MATKPDFAQKLLNDLRLRKQRMAAAQNSSNSGFDPADAHGNSRQALKGSKQMRTQQAVGSKTESRFKSSSTSHKSPATVQAANQIVPYEGHHRSGERGDLSMALAYAFDNGGNLKRIDFTGSGKMMDFLQQIGRRSMQKSSNTQWPSTTQFPTLTHLHIDEIAKGAHKLNQILRACSNGLNIDKGTVDIGNELWKGAMELEQSLRMLVSLQEASENMLSPRRKSNIKLLEEGEDGEEDSTSSTDKQKQIERPVFSFDKPSKNRKSTVQTSPQQKLMALTYLKEDLNSKPEKQVPTTPTGISHRHSATSGLELHKSQHTNSSRQKHDTGIPNVIAKLMGLEELSQKANPKVVTERGSKKRSGHIVSTRTENAKSRGAQVKIEYANNVQENQNDNQSNKIAILKYHEPRLQQETFTLTYDYRYRARADSHKPMQNKEEKEAIRSNVIESQAAISKINELQSQIMQLNQNSSSHKDESKEARQRKQQEVKDEKEAWRTMVPVKNQRSEAAVKVQAERLANWSDQTEKRSPTKALVPQQKPKEHESLFPGHATQGKSLKLEDRRQPKRNNKSELRTEAKSKRLNGSTTVASYVKNLQKQLPTTPPNSTKENNAEAKGLTVSKALSNSSRGQDKHPTSNSKATNSDAKQKNPENLKSEPKSLSTDGISGAQKTQAQKTLNIDAQPAHVLAKKLVDEIKPPKMGSTAKMNTQPNEDITKAVKKANKSARVPKPHISISQAYQTSDSKSKPTQPTQKNAKSRAHKSQQAEADQLITTNNSVRPELQNQEDIPALPPSEKSQDTKTSKDSDSKHNQEIVPDEGQQIRPQRTATDTFKGSKDIPYVQPARQSPTKIEKPEPLTEDQMYLKQKLITSHLFLNTAEALFKLNIPIGILNYAIDQLCQERDSKLILDCGYELLKKKGRKQEMFLHPHISMLMSCRRITSLDDLVRQLHKDFESLRCYGRNGTEEYDDADYILRMLERDIHYRAPDINCMWDLGWNELMFAYVETDELRREMEHEILDELMNEIAKDCM